MADELVNDLKELVLSPEEKEDIDTSKVHKVVENAHRNKTVAESISSSEELKKPLSSSKTALIYDDRLTQYWCTTFPNHVERPARVSSIYQKLIDERLTEKCTILQSRCATKEEVLLKHTEEHLNFILSVKDMKAKELADTEEYYESIYFHRNVTECSFLAAGCTLEIVEKVLQNSVTNGAAIVRPPGHHALEHCSMGFCHFNNVAIAAMMAIKKYGLKRILIVDWDIHYGNGIHKMFETDPRVLYFSMHRYDHQNFWPGLSEGSFDSVGKGDGEGFNIHVAWNARGMGDSDYMCAFKNILMPIAKQYQPELVLVSCGFDSGQGDPLGCCKVTPTGYAHMTRMLMDLASGKLVLVLEGGYNLTTIANSMAACVETLLGEPVCTLVANEPCGSALNSIRDTFSVMLKYWKCLIENQDKLDKIIHDEREALSSSGSEEDLFE